VSVQKKNHAKKSLRPVLGASAIFLLVLLGVGGLKSTRDLGLARERVEDLEQGILEAESRIRQLERSIDRLRNDPLTLERRAREDLGLAFPDDLIYLLPEEPPEEPPAVENPTGSNPDSTEPKS